MTPRKKLIEVALPLKAISAACKADKDRKTGTIRNIHKWFAPMPSPAWRALLLAALLDDPDDEFSRVQLLELIESLVPSDGGLPPAGALAEARQRLRNQYGDELPTVVDPFCGGGSTVVEAQRLHLPTFASDLNPIPVLITSVLTSIPPKVAGSEPLSGGQQLNGMTAVGLEGFMADVKHYAGKVRDRVWREVGSRDYPLGPSGETVAAWIWARTVRCPNPACGVTMPLVSSYWLDKREDRETWLEPVIEGKSIKFDLRSGPGVLAAAPKQGRGASFRCLACGQLAPADHLKSEGQAGRLGYQLLAAAADSRGSRVYLTASPEQKSAAAVSPPEDAPDEELADEPRSIWCTSYGIHRHRDLYTARQLVSLDAFCRAVADVPDLVAEDGGADEYGKAIAMMLGLCIGKLAQSSSTQVRWRVRKGPSKAEPAFGRHDLPMVWDFAETNPFGGSVGDWSQVVETALRSLPLVGWDGPPSDVRQLDARAVADALAKKSCLVATDPPYFDNIGYADLSDYFYVWIRRAIGGVLPDLFATITTPKAPELVAVPARHGGNKSAAKAFFVEGFTSTFRALRMLSRPDLPLLVVYAFKQEESGSGDSVSTGWEAMLEALLQSGHRVVGTWPVHGTGASRQIGLQQNALASYIVLVARPRPEDAPMATRREFLVALREELPGAVRQLQRGNIAPVDLAQAAIGPGMEVFSRYTKVVEADGARMSVRDALAQINRTFDETLSEQEADFDSATRWALAWFDDNGLKDGPFGQANVLATAKNIGVDALAHEGFLVSKAGKVRLLGWSKLDPGWNPATDKRLTIWEVTHYLIRAHQDPETGSEQAAADLLKKVGHAMGETARDLAYRLYSISERKGWAKEALAYNALVVAWPEIARLAAVGGGGAQANLGV